MTKIVDYYAHEVKHFVDAMKYKLHVHRAKGKWEGKDLNELFQLMTGEVRELREAVDEGNQIAIILEAADIANYAMIITNVAMKIASGQNVLHSSLDKCEDRLAGIAACQAAHLTASQEDIKRILPL